MSVNVNDIALLTLATNRSKGFAGLREKHQQDLEKLTLTSQPFKTLRLFVVAVFLYVRRWSSYLLANVGWLILFCSIFVAFAALLVTLDGPHVKVNRFRLLLSVGLASDVSLLGIRNLRKLLDEKSYSYGFSTAIEIGDKSIYRKT